MEPTSLGDAPVELDPSFTEADHSMIDPSIQDTPIPTPPPQQQQQQSQTQQSSQPQPSSRGSVPTVHRKQNLACDHCRSKKVRCIRASITERCDRCVAHEIPCTSEYVESLQAKLQRNKEEKEARDAERRNRITATSAANHHQRQIQRSERVRVQPPQQPQHVNLDGSVGGPRTKRTKRLHEWEERMGRIPPQSQSQTQLSGGSGVGDSLRSAENALIRSGSADLSANNHNHLQDLSLHAAAAAAAAASQTTEQYTSNSTTASERQWDLLRYLFSSRPVLHGNYGYTDRSSLEMCKSGRSDLWEEHAGRVWDEQPTEAHLSAAQEDRLMSLAEDLLLTWFSIAHVRSPLIDPSTIQDRFRLPDHHPLGPIPHGLLAVILAYGARFSDHPLITSDREELVSRGGDNTGGGGRPRSRIVSLMVIRAREVCESGKIHRVPTVENVQALVFLESLLAQEAFMKKKYQKYHAAAAARLIPVLEIPDPTAGGIQGQHLHQEALWIKWLACLLDAFRSAFYGLQPSVSDADCEASSEDIRAMISTGEPAPETENWLSAATSGGSICRKLCRDIYTPNVRRSGVTISALRDFIHACSEWRDNYLSKLGVPSEFPPGWDFHSAVTACSIDAYYHCLWLTMGRCISEYGIQEIVNGGPGATVEVEHLMKRVQTESEHGALRIAALVAVLTNNGYLRLDPLTLSHPIYAAGLHLASMAREECKACVMGLKQYSISYGVMWDLAEEIENIYHSKQGNNNPLSMDSGPSSTVDAGLMVPDMGGAERFMTGTEGEGMGAVADRMMAQSGFTTGTSTGATGGEGSQGDEGAQNAWPPMDVAVALFDWLQQSSHT